MCEPVTLTMMGLAIASAAVSYSAQQKQANDQAKYQNTLQDQANTSASESYRFGTQGVTSRLIQNDQQASQALAQNAVAGMSARATAATSAGESGIDGNSVNALLGDFSRIEAANNYDITTNRQWATDQAQQDERGMQSEAKSRIAAAMPGPINYPSMAALALQVGAASYAGWDKHQQITRTGPYNPNNQNSGWTKPLMFS